MRLTEFEVQAIKQSAREVFGAGVGVALFGSRVDDAQRGGDIDLYIKTATGNDLAHKIKLPLSNPKWVMLHSEQPMRHDCTFIF